MLDSVSDGWDKKKDCFADLDLEVIGKGIMDLPRLGDAHLLPGL